MAEVTVATLNLFINPAIALIKRTFRSVHDRPDASDKTLYPSDHFGLMARLQVG